MTFHLLNTERIFETVSKSTLYSFDTQVSTVNAELCLLVKNNDNIMNRNRPTNTNTHKHTYNQATSKQTSQASERDKTDRKTGNLVD